MSKNNALLSYIIGFVLSVVCTLIPYHLVVNKSLSGDRLLVTIIGFAVLQMAIQIIFFLHLGRGPKPLYNVGFFAATVGVIVLIIAGSLFIMTHLHYNMTATDTSVQLAQDEGIYQVEGNKTGACKGVSVKSKHVITFVNGTITPTHTDAHLCDALTFQNEDGVIRDIAFGPHDTHIPYGAVAELQLHAYESQTITLTELGTYPYHDHLQESAAGDFTVRP